MSNVAIKGTAYCLNYTPELALHYGTTTMLERRDKAESAFLAAIPGLVQSYQQACRYAPNLTYIGAMSTDELTVRESPWYEKLEAQALRFGSYGEIMPEDEFIGLMDICDVFDLLWLDTAFAATIKPKLLAHPLLSEAQCARLEAGHSADEIYQEIAQKKALPLYFEGKIVACSRRGHEVDENLCAHVLMENIASKAGGVLALLHLIHNADLQASDIDYVIECSEEAVGDMNQRGGGNMAKAIAEIAGCANASGCDVRTFCSGPVASLLAGAGMVASGIRANVAVVAGGAIPKLYMNAREHVKKHLPPLENCLGNFGVLLVPEDGLLPIIRLDAVGKHSVGAGAAPQAITSALVLEPLTRAGLGLNDVDKYAAELHIPEITVPAGAGNVPEANYKMIAALGVMKGQVQRADIPNFVSKRGLPGFAHTQGHIPSGVPFIGHAVDAIKAGRMTRAMIIGKGSLFLGRLTNLADGSSFLIEGPEKKEVREEVTLSPYKVEEGKQRIGLMAAGNELGVEEFFEGARLAMQQDSRLQVVAIGPKPALPIPEGLDWMTTEASESAIAAGMEAALKNGTIAGAVALHYPFPVGVTTIGRLQTPARGKAMFLASCTGTAATNRAEALLRNALYGIAVAKALGVERPTLGILNLDSAPSVERSLRKLKEGGYDLTFGSSVRTGGGALLRGNDLLTGTVDVCVCDTLTGNVLMKMFSAYATGGQYEALGWGYGPSVGENWPYVVSIVSRASGATVICNALLYNVAAVRGKVSQKVTAELQAATRAGFDEALRGLASPAVSPLSQELPPPAVPTDDEIHGIDVLELENATGQLWKAGIYAEAAMGCTGPVIKIAHVARDEAIALLQTLDYL